MRTSLRAVCPTHGTVEAVPWKGALVCPDPECHRTCSRPESCNQTSQPSSLFEYGIALKDDTSDPHRSNMNDDEAQEWMSVWVQETGRAYPFRIIRRPVGEWEFVS